MAQGQVDLVAHDQAVQGQGALVAHDRGGGQQQGDLLLKEDRAAEDRKFKKMARELIVIFARWKFA